LRHFWVKWPVTRTEHDIQVEVAEFLARALAGVCWWSGVDHGAGKMGKAAAGRRKARGIRAGIPDILVLWQGRLIGLEMKDARGTQSAPQRELQAEWQIHGAGYHVCRSLEDVDRALAREGVPMRYRVTNSGLGWVFVGGES
jgi:hypothetical protein